MSIVKHKYKLNIFNKDSLTNLIENLKAYRGTLQSKVDAIAKELSLLGVEYAISNLVGYKALFSGELIRSINHRQVINKDNTAVYMIVADSEHAAFVEFGTGWKGLAKPYPVEIPQGNYGDYTGYVSGKQIVNNAKKGIYGWYYKGTDGKWYFTEGMPSRPFMYETSQDIYNIAESVARKVFREMR